MSDANKLRKLSRQIKLLEHLQLLNTHRLAYHSSELTSLQAKAADLDEDEQGASSLDFLDVRLAFRAALVPRMRETSDMIEKEAGRSAVLKRRTEAASKKAATIESRAQEAADFEQLQTMMSCPHGRGSPALRKLKPR